MHGWPSSLTGQTRTVPLIRERDPPIPSYFRFDTGTNTTTASAKSPQTARSLDLVVAFASLPRGGPPRPAHQPGDRSARPPEEGPSEALGEFPGAEPGRSEPEPIPGAQNGDQAPGPNRPLPVPPSTLLARPTISGIPPIERFPDTPVKPYSLGADSGRGCGWSPQAWSPTGFRPDHRTGAVPPGHPCQACPNSLVVLAGG
jgi:hypothetical protein